MAFLNDLIKQIQSGIGQVFGQQQGQNTGQQMGQLTSMPPAQKVYKNSNMTLGTVDKPYDTSRNVPAEQTYASNPFSYMQPDIQLYKQGNQYQYENDNAPQGQPYQFKLNNNPLPDQPFNPSVPANQPVTANPYYIRRNNKFTSGQA